MPPIEVLHVLDTAHDAKFPAFRHSCRIKTQASEIVVKADRNEWTWPAESCHPVELVPGRQWAGARGQRPGAPKAAALAWNHRLIEETHRKSSIAWFGQAINRKMEDGQQILLPILLMIGVHQTL
jgi:hypothetical protein